MTTITFGFDIHHWIRDIVKVKFVHNTILCKSL